MTAQGSLLGRVMALLDDAGIPHMVVGSLASPFHGEPRQTRNINIVIDPNPNALRRLLQQLPPDQLYADAHIATAEDTIIAKLEWATQGQSERQLRDAAILGAQAETLDLDYLDRWIRAFDLDDAWSTLDNWPDDAVPSRVRSAVTICSPADAYGGSERQLASHGFLVRNSD